MDVYAFGSMQRASVDSMVLQDDVKWVSLATWASICASVSQVEVLLVGGACQPHCDSPDSCGGAPAHPAPSTF